PRPRGRPSRPRRRARGPPDGPPRRPQRPPGAGGAAAPRRPLRRKGRAGPHRPAARRRRFRTLPALGRARLAGLAGHPHLLSHRIPQSPRRHARLGARVLDVPAACAAPHGAAASSPLRGIGGGARRSRHPFLALTREMNDMRQTVLAAALAAALASPWAAGPAFAQSPAPPAGDATDANKPRAVPGFDPGAMDRSVPPCDDFYQFACGTWIKNNPVPADRSRYGRFDELTERNQTTLRTILEEAARRNAPQATTARPSGIHSREAAGGAWGGAGSAPQIDQ